MITQSLAVAGEYKANENQMVIDFWLIWDGRRRGAQLWDEAEGQGPSAVLLRCNLAYFTVLIQYLMLILSDLPRWKAT